VSPALSLDLSRDLFPCPADVAQLVAHPTLGVEAPCYMRLVSHLLSVTAS
jgi:hypothetical protein